MYWIDYIGDSKKTIEIIFKDNIPKLNDIEIKEIILGYQYTNSVIISFDLCKYPKDPPLKWRKNGENEISIKLLFSEIENFKTTFWESQYNKKARINISKNKEYLNISIIGDAINITFISKSISMLEFYSYIHEDR